MDEGAKIQFHLMSRMTRPYTDLCLALVPWLYAIGELRVCSCCSSPFVSTVRATQQRTKCTPGAAHEHCAWVNSPGFNDILTGVIADSFDDRSRDILKVAADVQENVDRPAATCLLRVSRS